MWSSVNPAELGYYWVRNLQKHNAPPEESFYAGPEIVEVVNIINELEVEYCGSGQADKLYAVSGEWYGPIEPPE